MWVNANRYSNCEYCKFLCNTKLVDVNKTFRKVKHNLTSAPLGKQGIFLSVDIFLKRCFFYPPNNPKQPCEAAAHFVFRSATGIVSSDSSVPDVHPTEDLLFCFHVLFPFFEPHLLCRDNSFGKIKSPPEFDISRA